MIIAYKKSVFVGASYYFTNPLCRIFATVITEFFDKLCLILGRAVMVGKRTLEYVGRVVYILCIQIQMAYLHTVIDKRGLFGELFYRYFA